MMVRERGVEESCRVRFLLNNCRAVAWFEDKLRDEVLENIEEDGSFDSFFRLR